MKIDYTIATITNDSVKSRTIECVELARWMLFRDNIAFCEGTFGASTGREKWDIISKV